MANAMSIARQPSRAKMMALQSAETAETEEALKKLTMAHLKEKAKAFGITEVEGKSHTKAPWIEAILSPPAGPQPPAAPSPPAPEAKPQLTEEQLLKLKLLELKERAAQLGITQVAKANTKAPWVEAILGAGKTPPETPPREEPQSRTGRVRPSPAGQLTARLEAANPEMPAVAEYIEEDGVNAHADASLRLFPGPLYRAGADGPLPDDVHQGDLHNCYFAAGMNLLAEFEPEAIKRAIAETGTGPNGTRLFTVTFGEYGRATRGCAVRHHDDVVVQVDDQFFASGSFDTLSKGALEDLAIANGVKREGVSWAKACPPKATKKDIVAALKQHGVAQGEALYANTGDKTSDGCVWPMLFEKAWVLFLAKVSDNLKKHGCPPSYQYIRADNKVDLSMCNVGDVCRAVAGWSSECSEKREEGIAAKMVQALHAHAKLDQPAALGTPERQSSRMEALKLYAGHQYAVLGVDTDRDGTDCLVLRNPHNKLKGGPGPMLPRRFKSEQKSERRLLADGKAPKVLRHRANSLPRDELYLSSGDELKAADTFLLPLADAAGGSVFESFTTMRMAPA